MKWCCEECGKIIESDPVASDDWGGEEAAIGPDCPECEGTTELVECE